jgi:hypothetical protein
LVNPTQILLRHRRAGTDALGDLRQVLRSNAVAPPSRVKLYYELPLSAPKFLVLDGRTQRELRPAEEDSQVMTDEQYDWMHDRLAAADVPAAFVMAADPILLPSKLAHMEHPELLHILTTLGLLEALSKIEGLRRKLDLEHWAADASWPKLRAVLQKLHDKRNTVPHFPLKSVVALSGDVHFSYNMFASIGVDSGGRPLQPGLLNLTCSAFKNEAAEWEKALVETITFLSDDQYHFRGMDVWMGGYGEEAHRHGRLLMNSSIALVDVAFRGEEVILKERYFVTPDGATLNKDRSFTYWTKDASSFMMQPESVLGDVPIIGPLFKRTTEIKK